MHLRLNFNGIFNAFITLFRVATGEGWNDLMDVLAIENGYQGHTCINNPTYADFVAAGN
jgi:hypothetical protein